MQIHGNNILLLARVSRQLQNLKYSNSATYWEKYQKICTNQKRLRIRHIRQLIILCLPDENTFFKQQKTEFMDIKKFLETYEECNTNKKINMEIQSQNLLEWPLNMEQFDFKWPENMEETSPEIQITAENDEAKDLVGTLEEISNATEEIPKFTKYNLRKKKHVTYARE